MVFVEMLLVRSQALPPKEIRPLRLSKRIDSDGGKSSMCSYLQIERCAGGMHLSKNDGGDCATNVPFGIMHRWRQCQEVREAH